MPRRKSTVSIPAAPARLENPVEKWRKANGLTNPEMAQRLGYTSVGGYHRFVRCEIAPFEKLRKFSEISGTSLDALADYYAKRRAS